MRGRGGKEGQSLFFVIPAKAGTAFRKRGAENRDSPSFSRGGCAGGTAPGRKRGTVPIFQTREKEGRSLFSGGAAFRPAASPDGDAWGNARGPRGRRRAGDGAEGMCERPGACSASRAGSAPLSVTGRKRQQGSQACRSRAADRAAPPAVRLPSHLNAFRVAKDTRRLSVDPEWTASSGLGGFRRPRTDGGKAGLCGTGPGMRCRPLWEGRQPADRLPVVPLPCGCRAGCHIAYMVRHVKSRLLPEVRDSPFPLDGGRIRRLGPAGA